MSVIGPDICRMYKYSHSISPKDLPAQQSHIGPSTTSNRLDLTPLGTTNQQPNPSTDRTMSSSNPQPLRKTTASLYLTTFILTLITLSTTAAVCKNPTPHIFPPQSIKQPQTNTPHPQTYNLSAQYPSDTYPLAASALATIYTLSLLILTLLATRKTPTFYLTSTLLSTSFFALFIGIIYLSRSSAILPCTAGTTSASHNPYVTRCQLRQTVFWSAVMSAVGFAGSAIVGAVAFVRVKRASTSSFTMAKEGDIDAVSVAPPSYQEKDKDVEAEGEWEERVRGAV